MADLFRPGDVVAAGRILRPGSRHESGARALIATEVQLVRRCDLVAAGVLDEVIAVLAADGSERSAGLLCRLAEIAHLPAGARVARALVRLAGGADVVTVNQDVVASCAGVTRVTANAELSTLAADGVVEVARCKVHILDRSMLERRSS